MRILLVEDDAALAGSLCERLEREGFVVDHFGLLSEAIEAVLATPYRLILLDRRLPDGDGLSLIGVAKGRKPPPRSLVLTAMDDVPDRIAGLDAGAEDYLIKPFSVDELLARMRVLCRREIASDAPRVLIGRLRYDLATREAMAGNEILDLPRRERAILDILARRAGRLVLREQIEEQVYGYDDEISSNALEANISRLRKGLADADAGVVIEAARGLGYMLRAAE